MDIEREILAVLDTALGLQGRGLGLVATDPLLGAVPELDSMAIVAVIAGLEDRFGMIVADEEIDGALFATVGSLTDFVRRKLAA